MRTFIKLKTNPGKRNLVATKTAEMKFSDTARFWWQAKCE